MNIRFLGAFCTALMFAAPAYAQSSFVMIIGELPSAAATTTAASASSNQVAQIEAAITNACARPFIRNLKGRPTTAPA